MIIAPSILSADFTRLGEEISACESAGADWIHIDVMDGHFVPNLTMGPFIVEACRRITRLPLDVHLMIDNPERFLEPFAEAGASHLTVHVETCPDVSNTLKRIRSLGCKGGVTINPSTPTEKLWPALPEADLVLVMTVNPGYSGQVFIPEMLARLEQVRRRLDECGSAAWLEVDGGISLTTIASARQAGANAFVSAKAIFNHPAGIADALQALRAA